MTGPAAQRVAWAGAMFSAVLTVAGVWLGVADASSPAAPTLNELAVSVGLAVSLPVLGAFILSRDATNRLAWVFTVTGVSRAVYVLASEWVRHTYAVHPGSLPVGPLATWVAQATLLPALILNPLVVVWAPNGRLPGRRWRWTYLLVGVAGVAWLGATALSFADWTSPNFVKACTMRSSHVREAAEV